MARQTLIAEVNNLHLVITKEWLKQAYFRKEKNIEYGLLTNELQDIEEILNRQAAFQEEFLSSAFPQIEDLEEYTPRFLSTQPIQQSENSSQFNLLFRKLAAFKRMAHQSSENQRAILERLQTHAEPPHSSNLAAKYEKEKEKVNKLTQKYNDLHLDFLNLQEMLEEITYDRDDAGKGCENCGRLREKILDLEGQLNSHPSSEIQKFKEMYEEIKAAHDEIAEELSNQPRDNFSELEHERENFMRQVSHLQETQRQLEGINVDLMKKFDNEAAQVMKLSGFIDEYEDEVRKKNASLDKAQNIIKKLNTECEKLSKDLEKTEAENEHLKKENRNMSKTKVGVDKKMNDVELMKKTEERLREEIISMKNKFSLAIDQKEAQINQMNGLLIEQGQEKNNLEATLEELEVKLNEIDLINRKRVEEYSLACEKIYELEEVMKTKDEHIRKMNEDLERITANKDQEYQHLKRQAENMIRQLNASQSTAAKLAKLPDKKPLESTKTSLTEQLEDALLRENKLKSKINDLITQEANHLKNSLSSLNKIAAASRAETEKWIMRNEEMEQRLLENSDKNLKLNALVKDLQKMIHFKNQQHEEYSKNAENLIKEMQSKIDFLLLELNSIYNQLAKDIFPSSQRFLNNSLSLAHEKIHKLKQDKSHLQADLVSQEEKINDLKRIMQTLEDEKESISKLLYRSNASIIYIDKHLGSVNPIYSSESLDGKDRLSFIPESESINTEITEQAKNIINKLLVMKDNEKRYLDRLNEAEYEALQTQKLISEKTEQTRMLEQDFQKFHEENRYLTEIAYKEKEEKIKLRATLSEISANEEKVEALTDYVNQIAKEKASAEESIYILQNELEKTQLVLSAKSQQLEDLQESNFKEISKLKIELESVVQESRIMDPSSRIIELQQIVDNQDKSLKSLQEKLYFSEKRLTEKFSELPAEREQSQHSSMRIQDLEERIKNLFSENSELKQVINKRESGRSPAKYATHLEKLISQKNEMIADLEKELATYKEKSFALHQTKGIYEEFEKLKKKKESDKKNFQKRVKEFELVLRYIEDKVNGMLNSNQPGKSEKMQQFIDELSRKNPNLTSWLRILVSNLEILNQRSTLQTRI